MPMGYFGVIFFHIAWCDVHQESKHICGRALILLFFSTRSQFIILNFNRKYQLRTGQVIYFDSLKQQWSDKRPLKTITIFFTSLTVSFSILARNLHLLKYDLNQLITAISIPKRYTLFNICNGKHFVNL